jgi:hypothetical protein
MTMSAIQQPRHTHHAVPLHERVERSVGADVRLLYGFAVPMLAVVGLIVALGFSQVGWLVPAVVAFMLVATVAVVLGVTEMLNEDPDE